MKRDNELWGDLDLPPLGAVFLKAPSLPAGEEAEEVEEDASE